MKADEVTVIAANREFYRAFGRRDIAAIDKLWSRLRPVACIHPGWDALTDRAAVIRSWRQIVESRTVFGDRLPATGGVTFAATHQWAAEEGDDSMYLYCGDVE